MLTEGITYNKETDSFVYDFNADAENCIIEFNTTGLVPVEIGTDEVYYFGYKFVENDNAPSQIRTKFFNDLRYGKDKTLSSDKRKFIINALKKLHKEINIHHMDVVLYPESRSSVNSYVMGILFNTTNIDCKIPIVKLNKKLPHDIEFNWKDFYLNMMEYEDKNGNHPYRESPHLYNQLVDNVNNLLDKIRKSDYFSIAETVKKNKYKRYISPFLYIDDEDLDKVRTANNILLIDDVSTTGATIMSAIKTIRKVNDNCKIIIFSIVGKEFKPDFI